MRPAWNVLAIFVLGAAAGASAAVATASSPDPGIHQQALLEARSVLPASTFRAGSPETGAFFTSANRSDTRLNGIAAPDSGPVFSSQPVQGFSAAVPAGHGDWWVLADNGYGTRDNSADWQLALYRMDLGLRTTGVPQVLQTIVLSDPHGYVTWKTVCDPTVGTDLPPFSFNVLPATRPAACGTDPTARLLTGFDFDPESIQVAKDGTFWIGDEFGPFLLHADRQGRLLEAPIGAPGMKSPQNPTVNVGAGEEPTIAQSRGFESLAINPSRTMLYPMAEGALASDDPQDLRILTFDLATHRFTADYRRLRLEMPGGKVNLTGLRLQDGSLAYPDATAPTGVGGESAPELTAVNGRQFLALERDGAGDGLPAPRFKKVFLLDMTAPHQTGDYVDKTVLVDLMAVPDPAKVGGDGDFFRFPFNTIEAVHVVSPDEVLVTNDNNFPLSNARARSKIDTRTAPVLAPDDNEFILVKLGQQLLVDHRVLAP
jgi:hypothetical protein